MRSYESRWICTSGLFQRKLHHGESENTAGNHVSLYFGKPQLDLVEPGRATWHRVQGDVGTLIEESRHLLRPVGRAVVEDDADCLLGFAECDDLTE